MKSPLNTQLRTVVLPIAAAILLLCETPARANCDEDGLSISEIREGDLVELYATNDQDYPVTYAVMVDSGQPSDGPVRTFSETLAAQQSQRVMILPKQSDAVDISCTWTIGSRYAAHDDDHIYRLPYADGERFRVLQGFESDWSHRGDEQFAIDFKMPVGTPVHAARGGIVVRTEAGGDKGCWDDSCDGFANFIVILHDDGTTGEYYHLQKNGVLVEVGQRVVAGQRIGLSGNTGRTAEPHLHFAVYHATKAGHSQSVPISFISTDGIVYEPRNGHYYFAVSTQQAGD